MKKITDPKWKISWAHRPLAAWEGLGGIGQVYGFRRDAQPSLTLWSSSPRLLALDHMTVVVSVNGLKPSEVGCGEEG